MCTERRDDNNAENMLILVQWKEFCEFRREVTQSCESYSWNLIESFLRNGIFIVAPLEIAHHYQKLKIDFSIKKIHLALTGVAHVVVHHPMKWKAVGSIPGQGTCIGCGFRPRSGHM